MTFEQMQDAYTNYLANYPDAMCLSFVNELIEGYRYELLSHLSTLHELQKVYLALHEGNPKPTEYVVKSAMRRIDALLEKFLAKEVPSAQ